MSDVADAKGQVGSGRVSVVWVTKTLFPGGVEKILCLLAERLDPARFEVTCLYVSRTEVDLVNRLETAGVRCVCVDGLLWPVRLFGVVRETDVDVVHAHSPAPAAITRLGNRLRAKRRRAIHVTTEHNPRWSYRFLTRLATSVTSPLDDVVIAASEEVARSVRGRAALRCRVHYQGIDIDTFRRGALTRPTHESVGVLRMLCVANYRPQKSHETLMAAAQMLHAWGVPFRLTMVGGASSNSDERYEQRIRSLVDRSQIEPQVQFLPSTQDVSSLMASHDVLVISSSFEAGPLVAMEAAAAGLPIVATDVGIINELFVDQESCLRVPIGDAQALARSLKRVSEDPDLPRQMAEAASVLVERFDIDRVSQDLFDLYRLEVGHSTTSDRKPRRPR